MVKLTRKDAVRSALGALGVGFLRPEKAEATLFRAESLPTLSSGLGGLPLLTDWETRSVSAENPTGEKGGGAKAVPDVSNPDLPFSSASTNLGRGWKVRPFLKPKAGETVTLMDVAGPAAIQHIWIATERTWSGNGRACVLRFFWDDEDTPSVEVPLTDFFAVGHDVFGPVNSVAVTVNPTSALNCYWPMPFRRRGRITFTNDSDKDLSLLAYQITYARMPLPDTVAYFHAQWRRNVTNPGNAVHAIADGIVGQGRYVGTFLAWTQLSEGWFGEGEVKFYLDGDKEFPTICGTGTEDYFGASYGFPNTFSTAYSGCTLRLLGTNGPPKWSLYRWHVMDPICFSHDLRVTVQALGWYPNGKYQPLSDDIASVAYWYQREPHAIFPKLPTLERRWPR